MWDGEARGLEFRVMLPSHLLLPSPDEGILSRGRGRKQSIPDEVVRGRGREKGLTRFLNNLFFGLRPHFARVFRKRSGTAAALGLFIGCIATVG